MTKDDDPVVAALKDWVDEMYADGRTTSLSNQEMEDKISELTKGEFQEKNDRLQISVPGESGVSADRKKHSQRRI